MKIASPSIPQSPPKTTLAWRSLLHDRGISDHAIDRARIHDNCTGWVLPIAPDVDGFRFKAYPTSTGAKNFWCDEHGQRSTMPKTARFYNPAGDLQQHIAAAGGVLYLASGEPDTLVLFSAGLCNATCTMLGEGSIPKWFVATLIALGVQTVRLYFDRDKAGLEYARKVAKALAGSGIALEIYVLPYGLVEKHGPDFNTLWIDCAFDPAAFVAALDDCAVLDLPEEQMSSDTTIRKRVERHDTFTGSSDLYEQWAILIERIAVQEWNIAPPNGKALSRLNFYAPPTLRDDGDNPDCQWNYSVHGFKDYANGGEFYNTKQIAELLNEPPYEVWKAAQTGYVKRSPQQQSAPPLCPLSDPIIEHEIISAPRHYKNGIPPGIRELLNGWHLNGWVHIEGDDVPRLDGFYTYYEARHDLIFQGQTESDSALSAHEVASMNRFLSYKVLHNVEKLGELFTFLFPYIESLNTGKERATINAGRPTARYQLPVIAELWDRFFDYFKPQMWRALLVAKYPDLPVDALEFEDVLTAMGATDDDIGAINDISHDLLAEHDNTLREALAELDWRIDELRRRYIDVNDPPPYMLAPGVTCAKTSQHKDIHLAIKLQREGGEIENRYQAAREGGWTLPAYRAALKRAAVLLDEAIVTVPNFTERGTITSECESVTLACEAMSQNAYMRGRIKLYAPSGDSVTVSPGYARHFDYDVWLADNGGRADIRVWDRSVDKLEKLETPEEAADRDEVSRRQTAINSRRDYEAEAQRRQESESEPGEVAKWVTHQGELRAHLFNVSPDSSDVWGEIITQVRETNGQEKQASIADAEAETGTNSLSRDCKARLESPSDGSVLHDRDKPIGPAVQVKPCNGRRTRENGRELENSRYAQHARTHTPGDISPNGAGAFCADQQGARVDQTDVCNPAGRNSTPHDELAQEGDTMPTLAAHSAEALERERDDNPPPELLIAAKAKEQQGTRTDISQNSVKSPVDTQKEIATAAQVSHDTIHKVETIERDAPEEAGKLGGRGNKAVRITKPFDSETASYKLARLKRGDRKSDEYQNKGSNTTIELSQERGSSYKLARLKRDHPETVPLGCTHPALAALTADRDQVPTTTIDGLPYSSAMLRRRAERLGVPVESLGVSA